MQSKISDINTVNWGESDINPLQAVGLGLLTSKILSINLKNIAKDIVKKIKALPM